MRSQTGFSFQIRPRVLAIWCAVRSVSNPLGSLLSATGETKTDDGLRPGVAVATFVFVYLGASFGILGIPAALAVLNAILIPAFWAWLIIPTA